MPKLYAREALILAEPGVILVDFEPEREKYKGVPTILETGDIVSFKDRDGNFQVGLVTRLSERDNTFWVIVRDNDQTFQPVLYTECRRIKGLLGIWYRAHFGRVEWET